jgi:endoglucanase Acf2
MARTHRHLSAAAARSLLAVPAILWALGEVAAQAVPRTAAGLGGYESPLDSARHPGSTPPLIANLPVGDLATAAKPTNQWYSSLLFSHAPAPLHAHPMSYRVVPGGFEVSRPVGHLHLTPNGQQEMRFPHQPALTVLPNDTRLGEGHLSKASNWLVQVTFEGSANDTLTATLLHGSPFSYYTYTGRQVHLQLSQASDTRVTADNATRTSALDPRVTLITINQQSYAVFAPTGARIEWTSPTDLILHLPADRHYFSLAGLPNADSTTLNDFLDVAYAFPTETALTWAYDQKTSEVTTQLSVHTEAKEGTNQLSFMGLYPHHWSHLKAPVSSRYQYASVRGPIRLVKTNDIVVSDTYHGILPRWPDLTTASDQAQVQHLLQGELSRAKTRFRESEQGAYWMGKSLAAVSQVANVADAVATPDLSDQLITSLKKQLEAGLDGRHPLSFAYDTTLGTMLSFPEEYQSISAMNDHHFHYGYWISAAAQVALRDPLWADQQHWGAMIERLIADIATAEHNRSDFPFLRHFDAYEGHAWASGEGNLDAGNNQESSSEAINAWAAIVLWAEATHQPALRDLGIYLYTTEIASLQQYWFDLNHQVFSSEFTSPFASLVFGGQYANTTWWTAEPRQSQGINLLPITPASVYLAEDPNYLMRYVARLPSARAAYEAKGVSDGTDTDIWQDVFAESLALADPAAALASWKRNGSVEYGETRAHTLYWLLSLRALGTPDLTVTANTPLYGVFRHGETRTYVAYNATDSICDVLFSDGKRLSVAPHRLAQTH